MPTQLETIISALENSKEPMTAEQLADLLKENGTKATKPENTVLSLVHKCRDIVNVGGSPAKYALRSQKTGKVEPKVGSSEKVALEAFCAKMLADSKKCSNEADVREKIVIPALRDRFGYDVVDDMDFEPFLNSESKERPDILVKKGKKRLFVVEIKKIGTDLSNAEAQLKRYFKMMDRPTCHFGILTDGIRWRFFLRKVRSGIPHAVLFADCSVKDPSFEFFDALSILEKDGFNNDIAIPDAENMITLKNA